MPVSISLLPPPTPPSLQSPETLLNLKGAEASSVDIDDRRYAFQVNHAMLKRYMYMKNTGSGALCFGDLIILANSLTASSVWVFGPDCLLHLWVD